MHALSCSFCLQSISMLSPDAEQRPYLPPTLPLLPGRRPTECVQKSKWVDCVTDKSSCCCCAGTSTKTDQISWTQQLYGLGRCEGGQSSRAPPGKKGEERDACQRHSPFIPPIFIRPLLPLLPAQCTILSLPLGQGGAAFDLFIAPGSLKQGPYDNNNNNIFYLFSR